MSDTTECLSAATASSSNEVEVVAPVEKVMIITTDAKRLYMSRPAAEMCKTIANLVGELGVDSPIPVPSVTESIMLIVIEYCQYKEQYPNPPESEDKKDERRTDNILPWDKDFMAKLEQPVLFDTIMAANFLECKDLLDLGCKTVANMIKGKSVEELRTTFHLKNEFTPEEEKKVREENEWCDERQ
jgi:S-phase kinase-associated protein 1